MRDFLSKVLESRTGLEFDLADEQPLVVRERQFDAHAFRETIGHRNAHPTRALEHLVGNVVEIDESIRESAIRCQ